MAKQRFFQDFQGSVDSDGLWTVSKKINILSIFDTIKHFRRIFHTCQVLKVRLRDIAEKFFEPHSGEKNFLDLLGGMLPQKILIG